MLQETFIFYKPEPEGHEEIKWSQGYILQFSLICIYENGQKLKIHTKKVPISENIRPSAPISR